MPTNASQQHTARRWSASQGLASTFQCPPSAATSPAVPLQPTSSTRSRILHAAWALLFLGTWIAIYRFGLAPLALVAWVPLLCPALSGRWGIGWASAIGAATAAAAAPYMFSLTNFPHGWLAPVGASAVFALQAGLTAELVALSGRSPIMLVILAPH